MTIMPPGTRCRVTVPASTANLGPGFDCIGCAVALHNVFEFEVLAEGMPDRVEVDGSRSAGVPATPNNLALQTARNFFRRRGIAPPPLALRSTVEIPNARGLGSSSTAIVGGLVGANQLLDAPLGRAELLDLAVALEGHPDNVAPALLGGLVVSAARSEPLAMRRLPVHPEVSFIFAVPEYEVRTVEARSVLPRVVPFEDAIFNSSRSPLVVLALQSGDLEGLQEIVDDRLHTPYRTQLFKGFEFFADAARDAGAAGFCISGAGPTMLAICGHQARSKVISRLEKTLEQLELVGFVREIAPDNEGTHFTVLHPESSS